MDVEVIAQELIRALRGDRSQTAFSRRLGYKCNVLYGWESGRRYPTAAEALRAAQWVGIDVRAALDGFYRTSKSWSKRTDPTTPEGVSELLEELRGTVSITEIARKMGASRFSVSRWLQGESQPRLPDFLRLIDAMTMRMVDFIAVLVPPHQVPTVAPLWEQLETQRRIAYDKPWTQAVRGAIELVAYKRLKQHREGWIAKRTGITIEQEKDALEEMQRAGQIEYDGRRWIGSDNAMTDTRRDQARENSLRRWCNEEAGKRMGVDPNGLYSFNIFTVSQEGLEKLRELHLAYFAQFRAIVGESEPSETLAVANVQLFELAKE